MYRAQGSLGCSHFIGRTEVHPCKIKAYGSSLKPKRNIQQKMGFEKRSYEKILRDVPVNVVLFFDSDSVAGPRVTCPELL